MARKFLVPIDLSNLALLNALLHPSATAPASPAAGQAWYDTTTSTLRVYSGTAWTPVGNVSTGTEATKGASPAAGAQFFATDSRLLYVGDGAGGWSQVGRFGSVANLAATGGNGTSTDYARADHVHRHAAADHAAISLSDLAAPTADLSAGSQKITNVAAPVADTDAANKGYVDAAINGLDWKDSVVAATTGNITLSGSQVIDAVTVSPGTRVLVKNQTTAAQNGIYVAASGAWSRATDADGSPEISAGMAVFVEAGATNADTGWVLTSNVSDWSGIQALDFAQFAGPGSTVAGAGLIATGNVIDVVSASAARIVVSESSIDLATVARSDGSGVAGNTFVSSITTDSYGRVTGVTTAATNRTGKHAATVGDGVATSIAVTHGLGTQDVLVQVRDAASNLQVECDVTATSANVVTLAFASAPAANSLRVTVVG